MAYLEDTKQHRIPRSPTRVVWYHSIPPELGSTEGIVACIVCNTAGSLVDGFARSVRAALAYQTETLAFVHTLYFLSPRSSLKLELNSDCLNLISLLKSTDQRGWKSEHLSPKLLICCLAFRILKSSFVLGRKIELWIGLSAQYSNSLPSNWLVQPPHILMDLLCLDAPATGFVS